MKLRQLRKRKQEIVFRHSAFKWYIDIMMKKIEDAFTPLNIALEKIYREQREMNK